MLLELLTSTVPATPPVPPLPPRPRFTADPLLIPPETVNPAYLSPSETHTVCSWKGTASYYDLAVDGRINPDAAWYYPTTSTAARHVEGYVAFWHGVSVER